VFGTVNVHLLLNATVFEIQEHAHHVFAGFMPNPDFSTEDEDAVARYIFIRNDTSPYVASMELWDGTHNITILGSPEYANTILDTTRHFLENENMGRVDDLHATESVVPGWIGGEEGFD
jgi:hypothetical protein